MAKMSKTQRIAILDFYNGVTAKGHTLLADSRTIAVMIRNGWATFGPSVSVAWALRAKRRTAYVTRAGLIAAGVDMDELHAEALEMNRRWENADLHPRAGTITNGTASHRNVARFRQDPYSFSGSQSDIEAARQHLAEQIERDHAAAIEEHEERFYGRVHLGTLTGPSGITCDAEARGMASGSTPHRANVTCPDCLAVEPAVATVILHDFDCASMPAPGTGDDGIPAGQEPRCTCSADPS